MSSPAPEIWLVRHGETEWSRSWRHTSRTDLNLTREGEASAIRLGAVLGVTSFSRVVASPMKRALATCGLCGFSPDEVWHDLTEWDYGSYEGLTTAEIRVANPSWSVWTHPVPGGESPESISQRADSVLARLRCGTGVAAVFSHGHFLRVLAARWLGLSAGEGRFFGLDTGSISVLGYERETPVLRLWNHRV